MCIVYISRKEFFIYWNWIRYDTVRLWSSRKIVSRKQQGCKCWEGLVKRGQDWLRIRVPIFGRGEEGGLVLWRLWSPCYAIRKLGWWPRCSRYCLNTASRNVIRLLIAPLTTRWITTVRQKLLKTYDFFTDSFSNSETPLSFLFPISFTCSYVSNRRRIRGKRSRGKDNRNLYWTRTLRRSGDGFRLVSKLSG